MAKSVIASDGTHGSYATAAGQSVTFTATGEAPVAVEPAEPVEALAVPFRAPVAYAPPAAA